MTDTLPEAAVRTDAPPTEPPTTAPAPTPSGRGLTAGHTPGGLPALPLALTAANTVVALASAAALTTGPLTALAAAAGTAATAAVAARTTRRTTPRTGRAKGDGGVRQPSALRSTAGTTATGRPLSLAKPSSSTRRNAVPQSRSAGHRSTASQRTGATSANASGSLGRTRRGPSEARRGGVRGAVGEVKALRQARQQSAPTRRAQRVAQTRARRQVADARRTAKAREREQRHAARGPAARTLSKPMRAARRAAEQTRAKARAARDRQLSEKVAGTRRELRKAPARREARRQLWRSAARHHGRRLLAAALALPLGLLGILTTFLGRKLGLPSLMYPGRRLYRRLAERARAAREERDTATRQELTEAEAAADATDEADQESSAVGAAVPRAPRNHDAHLAQSTTGDNVSNAGFRFDEAASEMYAAALSFDPDGMMQVLTAIESMPEALTSVANTFRVLAERCDSEFPLEAPVGEALNEVYGLLTQTVAAAEEVSKVFRTHHEADIRRHEDPRNGEEKWDTTNNQ